MRNVGRKLAFVLAATNGDGVVAVDGGANIGAHTIEWATAMTG